MPKLRKIDKSEITVNRRILSRNLKNSRVYAEQSFLGKYLEKIGIPDIPDVPTMGFIAFVPPIIAIVLEDIHLPASASQELLLVHNSLIDILYSSPVFGVGIFVFIIFLNLLKRKGRLFIVSDDVIVKTREDEDGRLEVDNTEVIHKEDITDFEIDNSSVKIKDDDKSIEIPNENGILKEIQNDFLNM